MAKLDTNLKLLIVVGVLGAGAAIKFASGGRYGDKETVNAAAPLFSAFKKDAVAHLLLDGPDGKKAELAKVGDGWTVVTEGGGKADTTLVDKVLGAIEKLKQGRVQSSSGDAMSYGVDGPKAIRVKAWDAAGTGAKPIAEFALGKIEGDWRNAFLQLPGERQIRKVEAATSDFGPTAGDSWRDKTIYDHGAADKVMQVEITGPNGAIVMKREQVMGEKPPAAEPTTPVGEGDAAAKTPELEVKETVWNIVAPKEGRAKKWLCDSIAGYVAKLECSAFHAGSEKAVDLGLDPPQFTIRVQFDGDGASKDVLLVGNKNNEGKYACKAPGSDQLFWIDGWKGDYLTKSVDDLLDAPPAAPTPEGAGDGEAAPADGAAPPANGAAAPADGAPADGSDSGAGGGAPPATDPPATDPPAAPADGGGTPPASDPPATPPANDGAGGGGARSR